ncbi:DUF6266 family protein [Pedobacter gandavensis]|uniref:DUF6266 family protein n=1 Tax=Pedobacter gandavensis TaxID=2679963 RepID=UPI002930F1FD|nr:DUF6266 family protein [Pedobacter gandavensis]
MGLYHAGVFGTFSGKVGSVVAARHRGQNVVRNLGRKSGKPSSAKQAQVQGVFSFTGEFLRPLLDMIRIGYGYRDTGPTTMNRAMKYHIKNVVTGIAPDYELTYPEVKLSLEKRMGRTHKPKALAAIEQTVKLSWELEPNSTSTFGTDLLYAVLYSPAQNKSIPVAEGVLRSALSIDVYIPYSFIGEKMHCWLFFASADKTRVSDTDYLGELTILA